MQPQEQAPLNDFGDYQLLSRLGRGATGQAWAAKAVGGDLQGQTVCLKIMETAAEARIHEAVLRAFEREARVVGSLCHPNIAGLLDSGTVDGVPFIAYELVDGADLQEVLASQGQDGLPQRLVRHIGVSVASALGCAHRAGTLHRDVKPANIVLSSGSSDVKLVDFGAAKEIFAEAGSFTRGIGTPAYWAPEQVRWDDLSPATDVFALGVVLFRAATGRHPFRPAEHDDDALRDNILHGRLQHTMTELPGELAAVIARCLAVQPAERYRDGDALREALLSLGRPDASRSGQDDSLVIGGINRPPSDVGIDDDLEDDDDLLAGEDEETAMTEDGRTAAGDPPGQAVTVIARASGPTKEPDAEATRTVGHEQTVVADVADLAEGAHRQMRAEGPVDPLVVRDLQALVEQALSRRTQLAAAESSGVRAAGRVDAAASDLAHSGQPTERKPRRVATWLLALTAAAVGAAIALSAVSTEPGPPTGQATTKSPALGSASAPAAPAAPMAPEAAEDRSAEPKAPTPEPEPSAEAVRPVAAAGLAGQPGDTADEADAPRRAHAATRPAVAMTIGTIPRAMVVYVDGKRVGRAPVQADLSPGRHRLRLKNDRFEHKQVLTVPHHDDRFVIDLRSK